MAGHDGSEFEVEPTKGKPGTTPEARENQLISLAFDRAEEQLRDGTASSQVITHLLKLGSTREKIEQERIQMAIELDKAKIEAMGAAEDILAGAAEALAAFRGYKGEILPEDDLDALEG